MLNDKPRLVRAEIAKHVQKIKLAPIGRTYIASGTGIYSGVWLRMVPEARPAHYSHGSITPQITFRIEVAA
jgi:hypothetical protein